MLSSNLTKSVLIVFGKREILVGVQAGYRQPAIAEGRGLQANRVQAMGVACSKKTSTQDDALLAAIRDGDDTIVRQVRIVFAYGSLTELCFAQSICLTCAEYCRIW